MIREMYSLFLLFIWHQIRLQGFLLGINLWRGNLGKMAKDWFSLAWSEFNFKKNPGNSENLKFSRTTLLLRT